MPICFGNTLNNSEVKDNRSKILEPYINNEDRFNVSMIGTLYSWDLGCCFISSIPLFYPCTQTYIRYTVLNQVYPTSNWNNYICCQGYFPKCLCFYPGNCGEKQCPMTCMVCESILCPGFAISASRALIMDNYNIRPDPCDNRLIRLNNFIQLLNCICNLFANFNKNFKKGAIILNLISECFFISTVGCMTAQVYNEINFRKVFDDASFQYEYMNEGNSNPINRSPIIEPIINREPIISMSLNNKIEIQELRKSEFDIAAEKNDNGIII